MTPPSAPGRTVPCVGCGAPILWLRTARGKQIPLDPPVLRAMPSAEVNARRAVDRSWVHPGRRVALVDDLGRTGWGHEDPQGSVIGREAHWSSCPKASRFRRKP